MATYARNPVEFVRGEGTRLWDDEGNEYLDFLTGISVVQLGHCHPAVVEAVRDQAGRLMHVGNLFYTEPSIRLAKRLADASLGGRVFFTNSGTEAIECALKLARRRRSGGDFVVLEGAFHGRTMGSLSATPQETKQAPFAPLVPGFKVVPRGDAAAVAAVIDRAHGGRADRADPGRVGHPPDRSGGPAGGTRGLRRSRRAARLRRDPVWDGPDRDAVGARAARRDPDVMTVAKGLGGGLPIGACVANSNCAGIFELGDHGSTFAGGPVIGRRERGARHGRRRGLPGHGARARRSAGRRPARPAARAARAWA